MHGMLLKSFMLPCRVIRPPILQTETSTRLISQNQLLPAAPQVFGIPTPASALMKQERTPLEPGIPIISPPSLLEVVRNIALLQAAPGSIAVVALPGASRRARQDIPLQFLTPLEDRAATTR